MKNLAFVLVLFFLTGAVCAQSNENCNLYLVNSGLDRTGALHGSSAFPLDGNEIYSWYNAASNELVAESVANPYFTPSVVGEYYLVVTDPDNPNCYEYLGPRQIDSVNGCCDFTDQNETTIDLPNFVAYNTGTLPLLPEGIEFDSNRASFIVSSAAGAGVSLVGLDGAVSFLVPPPFFGGNGTFGLQIDEANDRLLVVSSNLQNPTVANLFIFTLSDGSLIHNVDLSNFSPGLNFVNDVAVDSEGNAYVSNSDQGIIFKVTMEGTASVFFQDNDFSPADPSTETGFNGIEYHENDYLIVSHYESNKIYKLPIANPNAIEEVLLPEGFIRGGDGIFLAGNELVVVSNNGVPFVSKFVSTDDWISASIAGDTYATGDIFPTAVVKVGEDYMIGNSYFNFPAYGNTPLNYLISKASFDSSTRYSGFSSDIPRINTPVVPIGYGGTYPEHFYANCISAITLGIPDLQGDWTEQTVVIGGQNYPAQPAIHSERIEQCGNRILIVSSNILQEVFVGDDTMYNGVNDINPLGQASHATGRFENNTLILSPVLPPQLGITLPDVTRELIQDDDGNPVLKYFNAQLQSIRYLKKN
ncbi:hypothetical protein N8482_01380 [Chitinophagales bacterium]|nr:hypothetical protein [Chitinophagales bacterium]